jgi:uncharacterized NAD(P)/FAD-binding protein YdhS
MSRIAIIGAGAAGTLTAIHLLRDPRLDGAEVVLIDRGAEFGPGVAYRTRDPKHLLNVPASRMGGVAGDPEHFHAWLERRGHSAGPASFVPRGLFGDYLIDLLAESEAEAAGRVRFRRLGADAIAVASPFGDEGPLEIRFSDGDPLGAERVVLALGALPAGDPVGLTERMRASDAYVANPWAPGALDAARRDDSVLIVGTGLSTVDVALSLSRGGEGPRIRAISRNGLLPRRHREELTQLRPFPLPAESGELAPVIAAVLDQIGRAGERGGDWRDVFDSMRPAVPTIWRGLRTAEKKKFLAGMQRVWDVHRFRMAPEIAAELEALLASGRVEIGAASLLAIEPAGTGAKVTLRPAGREAIEAIECDRVVNCTGAGGDVVRGATPLLADLFATGAAQPDALGIGLEVAPSGALVNAVGRPSERIDVVGCLRKGVEWEAIGVTELREQAAAVAERAVSVGTPSASVEDLDPWRSAPPPSPTPPR